MNTKLFLTVLSILSMVLNIQGQNELVFTNTIIDDLNNKVAPTFVFNMAKNTGTVIILNTKQCISLENPFKNSKLVESETNKSKPGPYIGPIYWIYDIEKTNSTSASFQLDSLGMPQLIISFDFPKTIVINSRKNAFSDVHRTYDVMPHKVVWEGNKSLVVDLIPKQESNEVYFAVTNVSIKGDLRRMDQYQFSKFYTKKLATVFKHELSKVFDNPDLRSQISIVLAVEQQ